jgi:hypothetical protein
MPAYAQFDNDNRFQGPHQHADTMGRVIRLCLSLTIVPVFAPPREPGFQNGVENLNGRWQEKVWARFNHRSLTGLCVRSFNKDVAPILFRHCSSCHHPNGPGLFSVLTYEEVRRRATQIAAVTESRAMPPRKAEPGSGDFIGQERLADAEISAIQQWVRGGALEGDPSDLPPAPPSTDGWQLGFGR